MKRKKENNITVQTFNVKRADAESRLAKTFVAFVPTGGTIAGQIGYIFYSAPKNVYVFSSQNFSAFVVGTSSRHLKEAENVLRGVASEVRINYSEKDFHSSVAVGVMAQYARTILEWRERPEAFCVEAITLDCVGKVTVVGYDGDYTEYDEGYAMTDKVFLAGAYSKTVHARIMKILMEKIDRSNPGDSPEEVVELLGGITGNKYTGYEKV